MRALTAAATAALLACAALATALGQTAAGDTTVSDATANAKKSAATKACASAADALVWFVPGTKLFYRKGQRGFGKGVGSLVCRHIAVGKHGRPAPEASAEPAEPSAMPSSSTPSAGATTAPGAMPMPVTTAERSPQPGPSTVPTMRP